MLNVAWPPNEYDAISTGNPSKIWVFPPNLNQHNKLLCHQNDLLDEMGNTYRLPLITAHPPMTPLVYIPNLNKRFCLILNIRKNAFMSQEQSIYLVLYIKYHLYSLFSPSNRWHRNSSKCLTVRYHIPTITAVFRPFALWYDFTFCEGSISKIWSDIDRLWSRMEVK